MTMDKSLKVRLGLARARSVLNRAERLERLKEADRWQEGDSPYGLAKVRVFKLAMKKKKKKKEEEEGARARRLLPRLMRPRKVTLPRKRLLRRTPRRSNTATPVWAPLWCA